jgi:hypothetical protein
VHRLGDSIAVLVALLAAPAMAQVPFIYDSFTTDGGSVLLSHSPDVGLPGSWKALNNHEMVLAGGRAYARQKNETPNLINLTPTPGAPGVYRVSMKARWTNLNRSNEVALFARTNTAVTDNPASYRFVVLGDGYVFINYRNGSGNDSTLDTRRIPLALGEHQLDFLVSDRLKEGFIDGVAVAATAHDALDGGAPGLLVSWFTSDQSVTADDFTVITGTTLPDGGAALLPDGGPVVLPGDGGALFFPDGGEEVDGGTSGGAPPTYRVGCGCGASPGSLLLSGVLASSPGLLRRRRR